MTSDALQDPVALALLNKSAKATSTNQDLSMKQQITMEMPAPVNGTTTVTQEIYGQVRGQDVLMHVAMQMPGNRGLATTTAVRSGHIFMQQPDGVWAEQATNQALADLMKSFNTQDGMAKLIKEIHLGQLHTANGAQLQDMSYTLDPAILQSITDQMLRSALPPNVKLEVHLNWESLIGTAAIDTTTGAITSQTMDAAVTMIIQMGDQSMKMHLSLHQVQTLTPNTQPIVWPTDLPQVKS